jgi:hypothetical protein
VAKQQDHRLALKFLSASAVPLMRLFNETSTIGDVLADARGPFGHQMDSSKNYGIFRENSVTPLDTKSRVSDLQSGSEVLVAPYMDVTLTLPDGRERLVQMRSDVTMGAACSYAKSEFPRWSLVAMSGRITAPDDKLEELVQEGKVALRLTKRVHDIQVTGPDQRPRNYQFAAEMPIANLAGIFTADMAITRAFEVRDAKKQLRRGALVRDSSGDLRLLVQDEPPPANDEISPQSLCGGRVRQSVRPDPEEGSPSLRRRQRDGPARSVIRSRSQAMPQSSDQDVELGRSINKSGSGEDDLQGGGQNSSGSQTVVRQSGGFPPAGRTRRVYPFKYNREIVMIEVDGGLTVAQLIPIVAARFKTKPQYVTLLHLGKALKGDLDVDKLMITAERPVLVRIKDPEPILLRSWVGVRPDEEAEPR